MGEKQQFLKNSSFLSQILIQNVHWGGLGGSWGGLGEVLGGSGGVLGGLGAVLWVMLPQVNIR